jgi:DNA-binding winged helix-turn-helix (wHTH) protein
MRKISFSDFTLIPSERRLLWANHDVVLNPKAFDLLTILAEHPGHVISKEEIIERLWPDSAVEEGNLAVQISNLRTALKNFSEEHVVRTVPGIGYCFAMGISETSNGAIDPRCDHRGRCAGLVISRPTSNEESDKTLQILADCLENAASEREEIHLYSRKPHRGIQRANGGLFLEVRLKRVDCGGKSGIALEFTNPSTDEVRFRTVVSERELKNKESGMETGRGIIDGFTERLINAGRKSEDPTERSSRTFLDNMLTQASFLMNVGTVESIEEAEILIDKAIEMYPSDHRPYLLKIDVLVHEAPTEEEEQEKVRRLTEVLLDSANRAGAAADSISLASTRITGLLLGNWEQALDELKGLEDLKPMDDMVNLLKAELLLRVGRSYESKLCLQSVLERDPLSFVAMRRIAKLDFEIGEWAEAARTANSLLRFLPHDRECKWILENSGIRIVGELQSPEGTPSPGTAGASVNRLSRRRRRDGEMSPNREQLLAIAIMKEATGHPETASVFRRMIKILDEEKQADVAGTDGKSELVPPCYDPPRKANSTMKDLGQPN